MVNSMQAEAKPERSLEIAQAAMMSIGDGRLWKIEIKVFHAFHVFPLPIRIALCAYLSTRCGRSGALPSGDGA